MSKTSELQCDFCGASNLEVQVLVKGLRAAICDDCVHLAQGEIEDIDRPQGGVDTSPQAIVDHLNKHVIAQDRAKKILAVAAFNHLKRCFANLKTKVQKSNVWLLGPSGTGKTMLAECLADYLDLPFAIVDATTITEAGYVGEDPESVLVRLLQSAKGNIEAAQKGIVVIDEVDKLAKSSSITGRDIKGAGVQYSLLKMIEGDTVAVNPTGKKKNQTDPVEYIDTRNILFILSGAFTALKDHMTIKHMGIGAVPKEVKTEVTPEALEQFGMIPELIGRTPIIARVNQLEKEDLVRILTDPKDCLIKQYQALLAEDGVTLKFEPAFLAAVAEKSLEQGTGARGLRAIMESALLDVMFKSPTRKTAEKTELTIGPEYLK